MKKLAIGLGAAAIVVGVAAIAPSFIDWESYKPRITAAAEAAIGRAVAIDGPLSVRLLPRPTVVARSVRLANIRDGSAPDMARIESLGIRVAILPLFLGRVEIGSIRVVRPEILLETLADGRNNWTLAKPASTEAMKPSGQAAEPPATGQVGSPGAIALDDVRIEGGRIVYRDGRAGTTETLDAIELRLSAGSLAGPFSVDAAAQLRGQPIAVEGRAGALVDRAPIKISLGLPKAGIAARLDGVATIDPVLSFNGRFTLDTVNPAMAAAAFGGTVPVRKPISIASKVEGKAGLAGGGASAAFNDIEIKLGDSVVSGAARIDGGDKVRGDILLVGGRIDLDALLTQGAQPSAVPASAPAARPAVGSGPATGTPANTAPRATAGFSLPGDVEIAADIGIDALVYNRQALRDLKLIGRLHDGRVAIERIAARLPGDARISTSGDLAAVNGEPRFRGRIEAAADSLRDTANILGLEIDSVPRDRLRRLAWRSGIEVDSDELRLRQIEAEIDASRLTGGLSYKSGSTRSSTRPKLGADLQVDRLDLDAYLPAAKAVPATLPAQSAAPARPSQPAGAPSVKAGSSPIDTLLATDLDLSADIRVGRLGYAGVMVRDAHVDLDLMPGRLALNRVTVADLGGASVDAKGVLGLQATDLALTAKAANTAGLFRLAGIEPPMQPERLGAVSLDANLRGTLADLALAARLGAAGAIADMKGRASLAGVPAFDIDVTTTHPEFGQFVRTLAPAYRPRAGSLGPALVSGKVKGGIDRIDVSGLNIQAGPTAVNGSLAIRFGRQRPHVTADLAAGEIGIDRFLPAERRAARDTKVKLADASILPVQLAQAAGERWSSAPSDWSALKSVDANVTLKAEIITYQSIRLSKIDAAATLGDGVLDLGRFAGGLWGGSLDGRARIDGKATPRLAFDLRVDRAQLREAGLTSEDGVGVSEGIASFTAAYSADGASEAALVRSLSGKAELQVANGILNGINLRAVSDRLKRIDQVTDLISLAQAGMGGGNTPFSSLAGTFVAERGVIRTNDLKLAADAAAGDGTAVIDLPAWSIQSRSQFRLVEHSGAPAVGFRLEGALDKPRRFIETDALQQYLVQRGVGRLLQRGLGGGQSTQPPAAGQPAQPHTSPQRPEDVVRGLLRGLGR